MITFGLVLPTMRPGASPEIIDAGAEVASRLGWTTLWTTDHVMVPRSAASNEYVADNEYGRIFEAITTLAWVGSRHRLRLGTSAIVVPQRSAVVLAKELATLDALSGGRLLVGVAAGWNHGEFVNLGVRERFSTRGRYLDETIRLWRHLWSGSREPFAGDFFDFDDFVFEPLPAQGANVPLLVGGRSSAALRRAGLVGDGHHSSGWGPAEYEARIPEIRAAAALAGRPMPELSARVPVRTKPMGLAGYALTGSPDAMIREISLFRELGVTHIALNFEARDAEALVGEIEYFDRQVVGAVAAMT